MFTRRVAIHPPRQEAFEDLLRWMTFASPEAKADGFALWRVLLAFTIHSASARWPTTSVTTFQKKFVPCRFKGDLYQHG